MGGGEPWLKSLSGETVSRHSPRPILIYSAPLVFNETCSHLATAVFLKYIPILQLLYSKGTY